MKATLYVLPNVLSPDNLETLSLEALEIMEHLQYFAVENAKTTRRALRSFGIDTDFSTCSFFTIHHKMKAVELAQEYQLALDALEQGHDVGIMTDAGMAGIADPGAELISLAHQQDIVVKPIVGPSSIILALAASGLNGQQFTFHGYLPIEERSKKQAIQELEREVIRTSASQIFMETPYRNMSLFQSVLDYCRPSSLLCVASNITSPDEYIKTKSIENWKQQKVNLNKKPTIFILGK